MEEQELDVELHPKTLYEGERIFKWRKVKVGRKMTREFLVTWYGYPLDEVQWIPEANFKYLAQFRQQSKDDHLVENKVVHPGHDFLHITIVRFGVESA